MKKIYTMLAAAFMGVVSMSAAQLAPVMSLSSSMESVKQASVVGTVSEVAVKPGADLRPAPPTGGTTTPVSDYNGTYTWTGNTLLDGHPTMTEFVVTVDMTTGSATIAGFPQNFVINATFDFAKKTLTIPNMQDLGVDSGGDKCFFYVKSADSNGKLIPGASSAASTVGTVNNAVITFPALDIWAIGDPDAEELGWWWLTFSNKLELQIPEDPSVDPNEGWTSLGNATFMDGWVLPLFGLDQTDEAYWYQVEMQQNDANKNVYRLVNPYKGAFPMASYNQASGRGYIQFDVTNPDEVVFEAVEAGFANSQAGLTKMYCMNTLTMLMGYLNASAEEVKAFAAQNGVTIPFTTYKDGVVTLSSTVKADGGYENDACFGIAGAIFDGYTWKDESGKTANMMAKIIFPTSGENGVEGVAVDNIDAPVEYFNLQGVRVANPEAGQLVIKRQGNVVTKMVVR